MKRVFAILGCLNFLVVSLCGCAWPNPGTVETSIVYVQVVPSDSSDNSTTESTTQTSSESVISETTTVTESSGDTTKTSESVSLRKLNMLSGAPDVNDKATIATGDVFNCIGMTIYDIEAKDTLRRSISYATQGKYSKFTCSLAFLNDSSKNSPLDCFIEVYCDGKLTYTSESISRGKMPVKIETDISGAESVEIKFCVTNNTNKNWIGTEWAKDDCFPITFVIAEPEFWS